MESAAMRTEMILSSFHLVQIELHTLNHSRFTSNIYMYTYIFGVVSIHTSNIWTAQNVNQTKPSQTIPRVINEEQ